jgi:hypothetical protein
MLRTTRACGVKLEPRLLASLTDFSLRLPLTCFESPENEQKVAELSIDLQQAQGGVQVRA